MKLIFIFIFTSCASFTLHEKNIPPEDMTKIAIGQSFQEIIEKFGEPLAKIEKNGEVFVYYPSDDDFNQSDPVCKDLVMKFKKSVNNKVILSETFHNEISSKDRCETYKKEYAISKTKVNAAWMTAAVLTLAATQSYGANSNNNYTSRSISSVNSMNCTSEIFNHSTALRGAKFCEHSSNNNSGYLFLYFKSRQEHYLFMTPKYIYDNLLKAPSKGGYYNQIIRWNQNFKTHPPYP